MQNVKHYEYISFDNFCVMFWLYKILKGGGTKGKN